MTIRARILRASIGTVVLLGLAGCNMNAKDVGLNALQNNIPSSGQMSAQNATASMNAAAGNLISSGQGAMAQGAMAQGTMAQGTMAQGTMPAPPPPNVSFDALKSNLTPHLLGLTERDVDAERAIRVISNQNLRMMWGDLGRAFLWDRPSRLSPYDIISTSGQPSQ